jgi:hypothetical protein
VSFYYGGSEPPPEEEDHRGCRDVLLLTRAAFGILLLPMGILLGAMAGVGLLIFLFSRSWLLGLLGIILLAGVIYLYARWERGHFHGS